MHSCSHDLTLQELTPAADDLVGCMDSSFAIARRLGFDAAMYDFAPVPTTPEGALMTPSVIEMRNMPGEMRDLWTRQGLYQRDPVQVLAIKASCPFFWSYRKEDESVLRPMLDDRYARVSALLHDWRFSRGVTVPLHMKGNRFATMTGFWHDETFSDVGPSLGTTLMRFTYLAHAMNDRLSALFGARELTPSGVDLSPREQECIALAAEGLSAKQIAARLVRSEPTIVAHLQSAARKLGGRNRAQTIARAAHFGYLGLDRD